MIKLHKEGYKTIIIVFITLLAAFAIINYFLPGQTPFHYFLYLTAIVFYFFVVRFFRNPQRPLAPDERIITSPADGKVVVIEEAIENVYFNKKRIQVSIFMSPTNVHKNWYPQNGIVKFYKHHSGRFMVAWHPKSSELNERTSTVLETKHFGDILVRQIAGAVAQRIACYAKEGEQVKQGEELGFIRFGSRVDVFLPPGTEILVKKGQKVQGNITKIARWPEGKSA
jgi:phosphatidylserine decarboxylase